MSVDSVLDTNVLVYAAVGRVDEEDKRHRALSLIERGGFGLSGQILAEFYANVIRKPARPLSPANAMGWVERLALFPVAPIDADLVVTAIGISNRYRISYWDGAVIAAAERLGAPVLYSEDLNHDQTYGSVRVVNPFRQN